MSYLHDIAGLVEAHRPAVEADLADAHATRDELRAALTAAEERVESLGAILALGASSSAPNSAPTGQMTLHEAMRKVLDVTPGRRMTAAELAKAIDSRGLYKMRDGRSVEAQQIHARVGHYGHMFARDAHGIRLV